MSTKWSDDLAKGYSAERYKMFMRFVVVTVERTKAANGVRQRWHWSVQAIHDHVDWRQYFSLRGEQQKIDHIYDGGWLDSKLDKDSAQRNAEREAHRSIKRYFKTVRKVINKANREAERRIRQLELDSLRLMPRRPISPNANRPHDENSRGA